jgi:hypothetical protein
MILWAQSVLPPPRQHNVSVAGCVLVFWYKGGGGREENLYTQFGPLERAGLDHRTSSAVSYNSREWCALVFVCVSVGKVGVAGWRS